MINPYEGVNLQTCSRVQSVSHQHLSHTSQTAAQNVFDALYQSGIRHFPLVQYRPSLVTPYDYSTDTFKYTLKPISSDATIADIKSDYQSTVTGHNDVISGANAEHIYSYLLMNGEWYKWTNVHINGMGSELESGLVRVDDSFDNAGLLCPYSEGIDKIIKALTYADGGGVIINHPQWTVENTHREFNITRFIEDCLDYDYRVLGTDMIEGGSQASIAYNEELIDNILATGRRCWIFCQDDWYTAGELVPRGRNELLIPSGLSRTEQAYECMKAYRNGAFFGRYGNSNLSITSISYSNGTFALTAANADGIKVTIDGTTTDYSGTSVSVSVPSGAKYVRAMAYTNPDSDPDWVYRDGDIYKDVVFTNPIMLNERTYPYHPAYDIDKKRNNRMWLFG